MTQNASTREETADLQPEDAFFKQKTAYAIWHSDWSSDVCSSDLKCETRLEMRFPILYEVRPLRDDEVDRLEVEVRRRMERTSTNGSRT